MLSSFCVFSASFFLTGVLKFFWSSISSRFFTTFCVKKSIFGSSREGLFLFSLFSYVFLCFSFIFFVFPLIFAFGLSGGSKGSSTPLLLSPDWSPGRLTGCAQTAWAIALTCVSGRRSTATIRWAPRPASKPKWFEPKWLLLLAVVGCCWLLLAVVGCCCC